MNYNVIHNVIRNAKLWFFVIYNCLKRSHFCIMKNIVNDKKGHNILHDKQLLL